MKRFLKQIKLEGFGQESQTKLSNARVLVIGAGGLGCPALTYLAAAGVGTIGIVDHDLVDETNLHRQPLYNTENIGQPKVKIAAKKAALLNPDEQIITWQERISTENAIEIIKGFDLVLDCTDNYEARYLINDACVICDKPWIYGAVEAWEGQVSVFNALLPDGTKTHTYRCIFPDASLDALSCNDLGIIGTMPGMVGIMQANEAIKLITGTAPILNGLLLIDLQRNFFQTIKIRRNQQDISKIKVLKKDYSGLVGPEPEEINLDEIKANRENYIIIDIRDPEELVETPFPYADRSINMLTLIDEDLEFDAEPVYVLVCARGGRSLKTARLLLEKYPGVRFLSLIGGVEANEVATT